MKQFKGMKTLDEILILAKEKGYEISRENYDKGSDVIVLQNPNRLQTIAVNVVIGWFVVYNANGEAIANHLSTDLDNTEWYNEILTLLYESR